MDQFLATLEKWFDPRVLGQLLLDWTGRAVAALAIFVVGRFIAAWLNRWLIATMRRVGTDETLGDGGFKTPYPRMRLEHSPQAAQ